MRIRGFIELTPALDRELLQQLVLAAHQVSREGQVVLVLTGSPVDETMLGQARQAEFVIADSERLSAALLSHGVLHMRAREGVHYLRTLAAADEAVRRSSTLRFPTRW